jgi:hypothetical protein
LTLAKISKQFKFFENCNYFPITTSQINLRDFTVNDGRCFARKFEAHNEQYILSHMHYLTITTPTFTTTTLSNRPTEILCFDFVFRLLGAPHLIPQDWKPLNWSQNFCMANLVATLKQMNFRFTHCSTHAWVRQRVIFGQMGTAMGNWFMGRTMGSSYPWVKIMGKSMGTSYPCFLPIAKIDFYPCHG